MLIELLRGELGNRHQILIAGYPLAFFYLVACGLTVLSQCTQELARGWKLLALAIGLAVVDQFSKALIITFLYYQASVPVIKGWLHLAHEYNIQGAWVVDAFDLGFVGPAILMIVVVLILLGSGFSYKYYISTHRRSVWADVAFLGVFAGSASWLYDMGFRGHIVDFIRLPGVVTADLKDILVAVGVAAFFAEVLDNPKVSLHWKGWRREGEELLQLAASVIDFSIEELHRIGQILLRALRKSPGT